MTFRRRIRLTLFSVAAVAATGGLSGATDQCYECHKTLGDQPSAKFRNDVHRRHGVTCAGCHGGDASSDDMDRAMDSAAGFRGVPAGDPISALCAGCHADSGRMAEFGTRLPIHQFDQLKKSVHGRSAVNGTEQLVQCTTCHGAHGITAARESTSPVNPLNVVDLCVRCHGNPTYMRAYNPSLPVDQMEKYRTSVHGIRHARRDQKVATCVSCHGSHSIFGAQDVRSSVYPTNVAGTCSSCHDDTVLMAEYGIPTSQYEQYASSVHGVALLEGRDLGAPACNDCHGNHGAMPPGVESISKVCGSCHVLNSELFSGSPHKKAFDERHLPECETCHGNHAIAAATRRLLGSDTDAVCSRCHTGTENVAGYLAAGVMRKLVDSLEAGEHGAIALVDDAEQKGMEITEARFRLRDARQARLETRTIVHSFNVDRFRETAEKGLTASSMVAVEAKAAIDEYYRRRIGLGVATLLMTVLAISLYVFIKRLERSGAPRADG